MRRVVACLALAGLVATASACAGEPKKAAVRRSTTTTAAPTTTTTLAPTTTTAPLPTDDASVTARAIEAGERDPAQAVTAQLAYRHVAIRMDAGFDNAVGSKLPDDLKTALTRNISAMRELNSLGRVHAAAPPTAWHIQPVASADELLAYYREAETSFGVPWQVLAAIHFVETKLSRVVGDSSAGAQGPMQFMPATWARYGQGDIHANRDSILGAARYLSANGAPVRMDDALHHYNPTMKYVNAVKQYAQRMVEDPNAYRSYHQWQVLYRTVNGTLLLPEGWPAVPAQPVAD
jgi:membrane-bound lytic murein transglycosylase B